MNTKPTTTVQELRTILFGLSNQKMTVEELRAMLFSVDDQNQTLDEASILKIEHDFASNK